MHSAPTTFPPLKPIPAAAPKAPKAPELQPYILRQPQPDPAAAPEEAGLFLTKPASQWSEEAKSKPIPLMLFCVFWFQGELCILFADTNLGKSILAVQIAVSIAQGRRIPGFALEAPAQKVLYMDFELTDKQFEARYSDNFQDHFFRPGVCDNLLRAEINPEAELPSGFPDFEAFLCHSLEQELLRTGARVLIIDNITYLGTDTEKAKGALPLMKHLQKLKKQHGLSILVLAHTPKRDMGKPITKNDIQGSKMLVNFCDSSFAIGASAQDAHTRYLKQVKQRQVEERHGAENVVMCQIAKPHNFLQFEFIGLGSEFHHLRQPTEGDRAQQVSEALEMRSQGKSNVAIAAHFGVSETAVRKWIKKAEEGGAPF